MTKKQLPVRRILVGSLILFLGVTLFALMVTQVQMPPSPNSPLIGTWVSERGRVVNFRPDGTARYRGASQEGANQVLYFEWMVDSSNRLVRSNESQRSLAWRQRLSSWIFGDDLRETPMEIVDAGETGFTLRSNDGTELKYEPAQDKQMESAP